MYAFKMNPSVNFFPPFQRPILFIAVQNGHLFETILWIYKPLLTVCEALKVEHQYFPHDNIITQLVLEIRYPHTNICHINSLSVNIPDCKRHVCL